MALFAKQGDFCFLSNSIHFLIQSHYVIPVVNQKRNPVLAKSIEQVKKKEIELLDKK